MPEIDNKTCVKCLKSKTNTGKLDDIYSILSLIEDDMRENNICFECAFNDLTEKEERNETN